ncbi:enoyl-CoA hydratase/isomerase family protein [Microdochium bolleyi]|uniref:Enoyl-CoA hydratase/isomerase family protein n=1 Tax=Microdochium bolleyi TaxID=196109 RepID=A0A136ISQ7_9PEZI|nr:enoyl-CoA hydratase/isomerase family protein [Microdochium bolleyi]
MANKTDAVLVDKSDDGITVITINRPHRRNAVDPATSKKLYDAVLAFEKDPTQKVAILTGSGGTFCAGADLHEVASMRSSGTATAPSSSSGPPEIQPPSAGHRTLGPMGPSRLTPTKPLIAAIAGHAVAGGLELSLLCDLRVVEEDAVLGVFCRRWGVPLIDGGTARLPAIIGLGRALDLILTGRPVGALEALGLGLANRVVAKGQALPEARRLAEQIAGFPQACMLADRKSAYYAAYGAGSFEDALGKEWENGYRVVELEGVKGAAEFSRGAGRHGVFREVGKSKL